MNITIMKSKIHRATVTDANLDYIGSITIDEKLMKEAHIIENEKVQIVNINNGERFETYVIKGPFGKGDICLNGAAARLVQPKDKIIILSYCIIDQKEAENFKPKIVFVNEQNKIKE
ncbi:aspartate 1-decarboxylase [Garciella nitratireducens]|uniref:aspartate 1-decarboxylase n=1 Tax=Garciella nitratireducens TaxID=218205 RepID=UPI001BD43F6B|nr:aspartate 1-decarboxylase [Garciella nitratireducens]